MGSDRANNITLIDSNINDVNDIVSSYSVTAVALTINSSQNNDSTETTTTSTISPVPTKQLNSALLLVDDNSLHEGSSLQRQDHHLTNNNNNDQAAATATLSSNHHHPHLFAQSVKQQQTLPTRTPSTPIQTNHSSLINSSSRTPSPSLHESQSYYSAPPSLRAFSTSPGGHLAKPPPVPSLIILPNGPAPPPGRRSRSATRDNRSSPHNYTIIPFASNPSNPLSAHPMMASPRRGSPRHPTDYYYPSPTPDLTNPSVDSQEYFRQSVSRRNSQSAMSVSSTNSSGEAASMYNSGGIGGGGGVALQFAGPGGGPHNNSPHAPSPRLRRRQTGSSTGSNSGSLPSAVFIPATLPPQHVIQISRSVQSMLETAQLQQQQQQPNTPTSTNTQAPLQRPPSTTTASTPDTPTSHNTQASLEALNAVLNPATLNQNRRSLLTPHVEAGQVLFQQYQQFQQQVYGGKSVDPDAPVIPTALAAALATHPFFMTPPSPQQVHSPESVSFHKHDMAPPVPKIPAHILAGGHKPATPKTSTELPKTSAEFPKGGGVSGTPTPPALGNETIQPAGFNPTRRSTLSGSAPATTTATNPPLKSAMASTSAFSSPASSSSSPSAASNQRRQTPQQLLISSTTSPPGSPMPSPSPFPQSSMSSNASKSNRTSLPPSTPTPVGAPPTSATPHNTGPPPAISMRLALAASTATSAQQLATPTTPRDSTPTPKLPSAISTTTSKTAASGLGPRSFSMSEVMASSSSASYDHHQTTSAHSMGGDYTMYYPLDKPSLDIIGGATSDAASEQFERGSNHGSLRRGAGIPGGGGGKGLATFFGNAFKRKSSRVVLPK